MQGRRAAHSQFFMLHSSFFVSSDPTFIHKLDPRWKLAAFLLAILAAALLRNLPPAVAGLLASVVLASVSRLQLRPFLTRLGMLILFLAFFAVPLPFLTHDDGPAWMVGSVRVSQHGVWMALLLVCKAVTIFTLVSVLLAGSPHDALLKAAHSLRVPGLLVQLSALTLRYVFVLSSELSRVRVALRVRGYRNRMTRHSYRTIGHVAGTLLVRGSERAERVGQAMRCRGFDGRFRSLSEFRTRGVDVAFFAVMVGGAVGLFVWDRIG